MTTLQSGDVYCVLLGTGGHAWMQINNQGVTGTTGPSFRFRVNTNLPYYAYEQTTADKNVNCLTPQYTPTSTVTNTATVTNTPSMTPTPQFTYTYTITLTPTITSTPQPELILSWNDEPSSQNYTYNQSDVTGIQIVLKALGQEPVSVSQIAFGLGGALSSGQIVAGSVGLYPDVPADDPTGTGLYAVSANPTPVSTGSFTSGGVTFGGLSNLILSPNAPETFLLVMSLNAIGGGSFLNTVSATSISAFGAVSHTPAIVYGGPFNGNTHTVLAETATPSATATGTPSSTVTTTPTFTTTPILTQTWTATSSATATSTASPTATASETPTATTTSTPTASITNTPTITASSTATTTPTQTATPTITATLGPLAVIPDQNLYTALQSILAANNIIPSGTSPIYVADLTQLQAVTVQSDGVTSLVGMENCTGITQLVLSGNSVTDISPLSGLTGLTYLDLSYNQIVDISSVAGLTNLATLYLGSNQINDMSPVTNLINLQILDLDTNNLTAVPNAAGMAQMYYLYDLDLRYNANLSDISGLAGASDLQYIYLDDDAVTDLAPLVSYAESGYYYEYVSLLDDPLTNANVPAETLTLMDSYYWTVNFNVNVPDSILLQTMDTALGYSSGVSLTPADLSSITTLNGVAACITNLEGLEYCTALTSLNMEWNTISNLTPIANLTGLTNLNLENNLITDISPLQNLTYLYSLDLSGNQISNITYLSNLTDLNYLSLSDNRITDFTALTGLTNLYELELSGNQITSIPNGFNLPLLTALYLEDNRIKDLQNLLNGGYHETPATLYITGNPLGVNVLSEISNSGGLMGDNWTVDLMTVNIPDPNLLNAIDNVLGYSNGVLVTPADMASITSLTADSDNISSLEGLEYCTNLTYLELEGNSIADLTPLTNLTALTSLDLYSNQVVDLTPLTNLINLNYLELDFNQVQDLQPLVNNSGLGNNEQ